MPSTSWPIGVAVAQRGEDLVNPNHPRLHGRSLRQLGDDILRPRADPAAGDRTTLAADRRRAPASSFFSRSNISRYFRSMTGQS